MTGKPLDGVGQNPAPRRFDPMTGKPLDGAGQTPAARKFDPMTGEPLNVPPAATEKYEPVTEKPAEPTGGVKVSFSSPSGPEYPTEDIEPMYESPEETAAPQPEPVTSENPSANESSNSNPWQTGGDL
jgi:hypothetical protein